MSYAVLSGAARKASDALVDLGSSRFAMMKEGSIPTKAASALLVAKRREAAAALHILAALLSTARIAAPVDVPHVEGLLACSAEDIAFDWEAGRELRQFADSIAPEPT